MLDNSPMKYLGFLHRFLRPRSTPKQPVLAEQVIPRYPPFVTGIPVASVDRILDDQHELIVEIRRNLSADDLFDRYYYPSIRTYASFVHLLPASENDHHRLAGGLFRHGLEVALHALRLAIGEEGAIGGHELPEVRRKIKPRFVYGAFMAGLLHDAGKPISDMQVTDKEGRTVWKPAKESLHTWASREKVKHYFLNWAKGRHQRHQRFNTFALDRVWDNDGRAWVAEFPDIANHVIGALDGRRDTNNMMIEFVELSDQKSTAEDKATMGALINYDGIGVPTERFVMDAMRRLIRDKVWKINKPGAKVWILEGAVFLQWPGCAQDVFRILSQDKTKGIPQDPDSLARSLIDRQILRERINESGVASNYWDVQPACIRTNHPKMVFRTVRLESHKHLYELLPEQAEGEILTAKRLSEIKEGKRIEAVSSSPAKTAPPGPVELDEPPQSESLDEMPIPAVAPLVADIPSLMEGPPIDAYDDYQQYDMNQEFAEPNHTEAPAVPSQVDPPQPAALEAEVFYPGDQPKSHKPSASQGQPTVSTSKPSTKRGRVKKIQQKAESVPPAIKPVTTDAGKQAKAELKKDRQVGMQLIALAEDIGRKVKRPGTDYLILKKELAVKWPDSFKGYGKETPILLKELAALNYLVLDPLNPMVRVKEVEGLCAKCIVLNAQASQQVLDIADLTPIDLTPQQVDTTDGQEKKTPPVQKKTVNTKPRKKPEKKAKPPVSSVTPSQSPQPTDNLSNLEDLSPEDFVRTVVSHVLNGGSQIAVVEIGGRKYIREQELKALPVGAIKVKKAFSCGVFKTTVIDGERVLEIG